MHTFVDSINGQKIWSGELPQIQDIGFHLFHEGTTWEVVNTVVDLKRSGLSIQHLTVKEK